MSDTNDKKSLDYYIEHPDEFPTDPEAAATLLKELDAAEALPVQAKPEEKKPEEKTDDKPSDAPASAPAAKADVKIDGVLSKDGKHVIPYAEMERRLQEKDSSVEAEKAARTAAENYAREKQLELEKAQQRLTALEKSGGKPDGKQEATLELPADLMETLRQEYPTHAKAIEALETSVKLVNERITARIDEVNTRMAVHDRDRTETVKDDVQTLIGQNADLAAWQKDKPMLFDLAQRLEDQILADKPFLAEYKAKHGVDLEQNDGARYGIVADRVKREVGLPASASPKDKEDLTRKADDVVKGAEPQSPNSLSDIRGGERPGETLEENVESMPAHELASRMTNMTPVQLEKFLARMF